MWSRKCPNCGGELTYSLKGNRDRAIKLNAECRSCSKDGEKHPMYGIKKSKKTRKRMSDAAKGIKKSKETRKRMSEAKKGIKLSIEHRKKCRLGAIKRLENKYGQISPNYNPSAIPIIEQKAKELGITDLQHAENGGEFQVCGYWVDGYSKEKNIVIEYYEPFHKKQIDRDEQRKKEIIKELKCKFIEIKVK